MHFNTVNIVAIFIYIFYINF